MPRPQPHDISAEPAPSAYAAERLRGDVTRQIADLRCRLREATLRSDAYLAAGRPDAAAEVLAEQRALVAGFHDRIATSVSGARVEAEAEAVLTDVGLASLSPEQDPATSPITVPPTPTGRIPAVAASSADETPAGTPFTRHLAGLAAAALVAVAAALVALPTDLPATRVLGTSGGVAPGGDEPQSGSAAAMSGSVGAAPHGDTGPAPADEPSDAATRANDRVRDDQQDTLVSRVAALLDRAAERIILATEAVADTAADATDLVEPTPGDAAPLQEPGDADHERDAQNDDEGDPQHDDASEDQRHDEGEPLDPLTSDDDARLGSDGDPIAGIQSD